MSSTPRDPDPQEWRTYPGNQPNGANQPGQPYADDDEAYRAYQDYLNQQQAPYESQYPGPTQPSHSDMAPYGPPPQEPTTSRSSKAGLQNKWLWILGGIVAAFVISGVAESGNWWGLVIFAAIAWVIWNRRKR